MLQHRRIQTREQSSTAAFHPAFTNDLPFPQGQSSRISPTIGLFRRSFIQRACLHLKQEVRALTRYRNHSYPTTTPLRLPVSILALEATLLNPSSHIWPDLGLCSIRIWKCCCKRFPQAIGQMPCRAGTIFRVRRLRPHLRIHRHIPHNCRPASSILNYRISHRLRMTSLEENWQMFLDGASMQIG